MIKDFFTTLFVVRRMVWTTDEQDNPYSEEEEVGSFDGHLQQAQPELIENLGLSFTTAYSVWCPTDTDIKAGDTIESTQGIFTVKAVQRYLNGDNKHIQAVVELDEITGS